MSKSPVVTGLSGQLVVVTGAASGIGRALALEVARRGASVAAADSNAAALAELAPELQQAVRAGATAETYGLDVRDANAVTGFAEEVEGRQGPPSKLVNCAGVSLHCPTVDMTDEDFRWVMDTNFWGTVNVTTAFLPIFTRRGSGHVVNVSSVFGLTTSVGVGAYAASKFAVRGYTETLAVEMLVLGLPIFVTSVHPGGIKTPLVRNGRVRGHSTLAGSPAQVADEFERNLARTSAETCARRIAQVLIKPKRRLLVGLDAHLIDWGVRLLPSMHQSILARALRRTFSTR